MNVKMNFSSHDIVPELSGTVISESLVRQTDEVGPEQTQNTAPAFVEPEACSGMNGQEPLSRLNLLQII
jgi:hypothetical protein